MTTGYEAAFYRDIERIRKAQERIADVETARYIRQAVRDDRAQTGRVPEGAVAKLRQVEGRIFG